MPNLTLRVAILVVFAGVAMSVGAQYKCKSSAGSVTFQQAPCQPGESEEKIRMYETAPTQNQIDSANAMKLRAASAERQRVINEAIATGRPIIGMTRQQLDQAMGAPDKINAAQYGNSLQDQLIYYRDGRTIYVYTKDGVVTSFQNTEGGAPIAPPQAKPCPSPMEIRLIEMEISKIMNRDNHELQTILHKKLIEARACR